MPNNMRPIHPGEHLQEELEELGLSARAFAQALHVPTNRITAIFERTTRSDRRYGLTVSALLWYLCRILAQSPKRL